MNTWRARLLPPALAIVFSAVLCSAVLLISGADPIATLLEMVAQVGRGTTAVDIINTAGAYYLVAIAAAIGFQMNLLNIGIEGQCRLAACVAAIVGVFTREGVDQDEVSDRLRAVAAIEDCWAVAGEETATPAGRLR